MNEPPVIPALTVAANEWVCMRCQTVVPAVSAPVTRRSSAYWSPGRGFLFGAGASRSSRIVCGYCGSASLVPAGTPRGANILAAQGIAVTGGIHRVPSIGCGGLIGIGFLLLMLFSICSNQHTSHPSDPPKVRNAGSENGTTHEHAPAVRLDPAAHESAQARIAAEGLKEAERKSQADLATFRFHKERAVAGNPVSMRRLAELYQSGIGCEANTNAAAAWAKAAAEVGH